MPFFFVSGFNANVFLAVTASLVVVFSVISTLELVTDVILPLVTTQQFSHFLGMGRFLRRRPDDTIENVLGESVRRLRRSSRRGIPEGEIRYQMYRAFPRPLYGPRAKMETVFSVIKRKLSAKAPGRSLPVQVRQALLLGLTFNLYRLRHHRVLRGCQQSRLKSCICHTSKKWRGWGVFC